MRKRLVISSIALVGALLLALVPFSTASAHEVRHVGNYTFIVGFLEEPANVGVRNSLDLTICNGKTCEIAGGGDDGPVANPVNDADKSLKAEVSTGSSAPLTLTLKPRDEAPGKYTSYFVPTQAGAYTFHFTGTLNGQKIDEKFTSSPNGFGEVETIVSYPSTTSATTASTPQGTETLSSLQTQLQEARTTGTLLGTIGIIVGVLGLGTAIFALTRRPKSVVQSNQVPSDEQLRG
ncbi:hypothetical protein [Ktedonospora formicarum]|uniref:Uncharacterized protein n=1 Tax=Ktedonospora formicarum TaxID=2778364 RepID=A0A8J3I5B9_9CHLR|nr:hypothetical protein [Ktedonospora formicarum]GHO48951.1 hypothetical protein KSX_71140 [Ktedonospora formicarum]